jgi:predicted flap endonuclease-1-like 5' DNA nuclease
MSLLYSVIFWSRCRSNHHRLALDALRHMRGPNAEAWRALMLHHHADYLKGAKAPDDLFKDFKNHVLHVREGEWGGAIAACEEWRRRTLRALRDKDWCQAAWAAGVMSHYFVDPMQPFHTHQSEAENVIHRAVEQAFSKSYREFQAIIEADLGGYPDVAMPAGANWVGDMIRIGAHAATQHYETIIDHFDFRAATKEGPAAGLDQEIKDAIAKLVAHAAVGFARVLDRTFEEAAVAPPRVDQSLQAFFLALEIPIQAVLKLVADENERRLIGAQYEEYRKTGKVRDTLSEDDKTVRALHAAEVLKVAISSVDAQWPCEIGALHGQGAPPRGKTARPAAAKPAEAAPAPAPVAVVPKAAPMAPPPLEVATAAKAAPAPKAVAPRTARTARIEPLPRGLGPDSPVVDAPSIGPKTAKRLHNVGVKTIGDLLSLQPATGAVLVDQRHVSAQVIHDWQNQARLALGVPGLKSREAQALAGCGVCDADELTLLEPEMLAEAIGRWAVAAEAKRAWGDAPLPTADDVANWIARAKTHAAHQSSTKRVSGAA